MPNKQMAAFLLRFLPIALLILLASFYYQHVEDERHLGRVKNQEVLKVGLGSASLQRHIQTILGDLSFLAEHYAMQKLVNDPASPEIFRIETNFQSLVRAKTFYDQVRWIDASGQEKVRVDLVDGQPVLTPPDKLQNKAERYYFSESMQKNAGQFYISPLDLNVENNKIEIPFKPMLRLALPVADQQGEKKGILIINYHGKVMIDHFIADSGGERDNHPIALLDNAGYWLHSPNPADEWGFMFKDASRSLASRYPESWQAMQAAKGQFIDRQGLWTFESVYPLGRGSDYRWLVVSHLDNPKLAAARTQGSNDQLIISGLLLLMVAAGLFYLQRSKTHVQEAEQRFRVVFDHAMVGIATSSLAKEWLTVNAALCRILGYQAAELTQKTWAEMTHPDDLETNIEQFDSVMRGESDGYTLEKRFIRQDGSVVHTFVSARAIRNADGAVDYFVVIVEDVSNWVMAKQQSSALADTLQRFIDHLPGMAYIKNADGHILFASRREKLVEDLSAQNSAAEQRVLDTGTTELSESVFNDRCYESTKFAIPRDEGRADVGCITLDVTDRHLTQRKLAKQISRSAVLLDLPKKAETLSERDFMQYALDCAEELTQSQIGFMHFVNDDENSIELAAWTSSTLEKYCTAAFDCHYPITQAGIWADAAREKRPIVINDYASAPNKHGLPAGHSTLLRLLSVPVMEGETVRMMSGVGNKARNYSVFDVQTVQLIGNEVWRIVRRSRAEKALLLSTQVVNASPVVCYRCHASAGWPMVFVSDNIRQWGYSPEKIIAGQPPVSDLLHPDDLSRITQETDRYVALGIANYELEYRLLTAGNRVVWIIARIAIQYDAAGKPEFFDGALTDITELKLQQLQLAETLAQQKTLNKRLEEASNQLLQSEKMASIGQLAAGVAHELNNPIGFVHSNLGTLDGYLRDLMAIIAAYEKAADDTGQTFDTVRQISSECDFDFIKSDIVNLLGESKDGLSRVRKIVQDLKSFSRVGEQEWQEADLHQGIDSTLNIVWNELKYKCKVVKEYGDIPYVNCLISQINQVFMNLLINASHAIETQGTITIRTSLVNADWVCIAVSDTGKGIAPEHMTRIFEPFFTTKPIGKGTGLGLSLSYSIVQRHGGRIEVDSQLGKGTTFRLLLPIQPPVEQTNQTLETSS